MLIFSWYNHKIMKQIIIQLQHLQDGVKQAAQQLKLDNDRANLAELERQIAQPDFWQDSLKAEQISKKASDLRDYLTSWQDLQSDIDTTLQLAELGGDNDAEHELREAVDELQKRSRDMLIAVQLNGEHDKLPAIVQLSAGVGGTDAQDFTYMLEQMYIKYANTNNMSVSILDTSYGEEAGIKSCTLRITGPFAYGKLKCEKGVHRLVRLSPFNSQNLRQTSFALVDVVPELSDTDLKIDENDLRIDVFRAGGHGGQSVNTTDSAVRVTHLPTGITVSIQNERSQLKNKATAMSVLFARLSEVAREQKLQDIAELRGQVKSADWGAQIRSYVMHPYTKVKDHRTGFETSDVSAVLGGEIEPFIQACLSDKMQKPS